MKRIFTLLILYLVGIPLFFTAVKYNVPKWYHHPKFLYFGIAFVLSSVLFYKKMSAGSFYSTLRHELCHWLFSILSFNKPHSIQINPDGSGHYQHIGKGNYLLTLAPYFFPITSVSFLLIRLFFEKPSPVYFVLMGATLAFDLVSMLKDYHFQQSDWQKNGLLFSVQFSFLMLAIMLSLYGTILFGGFDDGCRLLKLTFINFKQTI